MSFIAAGSNTPDTDIAHSKLDDAVELLKTTGYTDIAGRLEADLSQQADRAE